MAEGTSVAERLADCRARIRAGASEANRAGMARFGIETANAVGAPIPILRAIASKHRRDHALAAALWATGGHEERILAALVEDVGAVTAGQLDAWVADFDSWDVCDQTMSALSRSAPAFDAIPRWAADERAFVRRAGFVMIAALAVHDKARPDADFLPFFSLIEAHSGDDRNFVKKAVNWALRQLGKRSLALHAPALDLATRLAASSDRTARWIGGDARRELSAPDRVARLAARAEMNRTLRR